MRKDIPIFQAPVRRPPHPQTPPMLVNEISRLFHAKMRTNDPSGVLTQESARLIMRELCHADGCSQLDLVHQTHLKAPTVSVTLKRMEEEELVRRETDENDMRVTRVFLSEKGREHNRKVWERIRGIDTQLMQGFSEEEIRQLMLFLERMRDNILPDYAKNNSCAEAEKFSK